MIVEATHIAGVDGCKAGWIAVSFPIARPELASARVFAEFRDLLAALPADSLVGVDMPIGLPDRVGPSGREPDREARAFLGRGRSRVFPVPSREAVYKTDYKAACDRARETSEGGWAPSIQAFSIFPRIRQIDELLIEDLSLRDRVFEVHPEVSFAVMNGGAILEPKKRKGRGYAPGLEHRALLLRDRGFDIGALATGLPRGAGLDDLLDACACAWSAGRILRGEACVFPPEPECDSEGLEVAIRA